MYGCFISRRAVKDVRLVERFKDKDSFADRNPMTSRQMIAGARYAGICKDKETRF